MFRHHFGKYGTLADIALMKDKYTGHPRGFGFIKFEDMTGESYYWAVIRSSAGTSAPVPPPRAL